MQCFGNAEGSETVHRTYTSSWCAGEKIDSSFKSPDPMPGPPAAEFGLYTDTVPKGTAALAQPPFGSQSTGPDKLKPHNHV